MRDLGDDVDALEVFQPPRKIFKDSSLIGENKNQVPYSFSEIIFLKQNITKIYF